MTATSIESVLTLPAGRELDALVAEKVMGLRVENYRYPMGWKPGRAHSWAEEDVAHWGNILCVLNPDGTRKMYDDDFHVEVPKYSTSIASAWEVVEKTKDDLCKSRTDKPIGFDLSYSSVFKVWDVTLVADEMGPVETVEADTAPLAICRAALKAVMG